LDIVVTQLQPSPEPAKTRTRSPRGRGRARIEENKRPRVAPSRGRRPAREKPERANDLDSMYLSEMAASTVLTPAQEVELGQRIAAAERALLDALVLSPSGARTLVAIGEELDGGKLDLRDVILNPDQEGLDLPAVRERAILTFAAAATARDEEARAFVAEGLSAIRLDTSIVDRVIAAVRAGVTEHADVQDTAALVELERAQRDLKRSKERLVVGNLRLVVLFARKYLGRGVPLLDLVQEGNLGLMRAADKFDYRRGFRFSTYAAWWIKQALQRALLDRALRLPVHVADDRRRISKVRAAFSAQHRRDPTSDEIAKLSGLSRERVETILNLPAQPASLDAPVGDDGEARLGDFLPGTGPVPEEEVALRALGGHLEDLLDALSPREQQVLRMRFGIGHTREHTLEEVGRELSLTRERIRQIERNALDKLRARSERVELKSYLDNG
jgi:RNA polymerase primary sigma factor